MIWMAPEEGEGGEQTARIRNCLILLATYERHISSEILETVYNKTIDVEMREIVSLETAKRLEFVTAAE